MRHTPTPSATLTSRLHHHFLAWFADHARPLPWRQGYYPYQVWISEIMLQQTQAERGVIYFNRWHERFPDVEAVATATEEEILKCWEGLGYYSRARNIHATAQRLVDSFASAVPDRLEALLTLPGIGSYTARAILSIAFEQDYAVVDANVERLFARLFAIDEPVKAPAAQARISALADALLPPGQARPWNQALMEFGALVCGRGTPRCDLCPVTCECQSFRTGTTSSRPVTGPSQKTIHVSFVAAVIIDGHGRLLVRQRPPGSRWAKLWELPNATPASGEAAETAMRRVVREETGMTVQLESALPAVTHAYTKYRAIIHPFLCRLAGPAPLPSGHLYRWLTMDALDSLAFSAGHRQVIEALRGRAFLSPKN